MTGLRVVIAGAIVCGLAAAALVPLILRGPAPSGVGAHTSSTAREPAARAEENGRPPQPSPAPAATDTLQVFAGKVVQRGTAEVTLVADDGSAYPLAEDDVSKMFLSYGQLRDRPVRLSGQLTPGTKILRVESVQTVKDGKAYDVDFWCEICQISHRAPGRCVCCGDETELRERPGQ
jgi:hypothetical protein